MKRNVDSGIFRVALIMSMGFDLNEHRAGENGNLCKLG